MSVIKARRSQRQQMGSRQGGKGLKVISAQSRCQLMRAPAEGDQSCVNSAAASKHWAFSEGIDSDMQHDSDTQHVP